jgi:hypothetical protein
VPDPATAFQNILRLPPGFALTLKNGHLRVYPTGISTTLASQSTIRHAGKGTTSLSCVN